jgi:predicted RNA-binding protein YlqC (UPF0109 family)
MKNKIGIREVVEVIISQLVAPGNYYSVSEHQCKMSGEVVIEANVCAEDIGKVIGKGGAMAKSMGAIVEMAALSMGVDAKLIISEPDGRRVATQHKFKLSKDWSAKAMLDAIEKVCGAVFIHPVKIEEVSTKTTNIIEVGISENDFFTVGNRIKFESAMKAIFQAAGKVAGRFVTLNILWGVEE